VERMADTKPERKLGKPTVVIDRQLLLSTELLKNRGESQKGRG